MPSTLSEVEEQVQERSVADGPSNPMAQHAYEGFAKRQRKSGPGSSLFLGAAAAALVLVLASVFGLWLLRSVRRLNRQVTRLSRQTEQLDRRVQAAEQQATASARQASQAAADAQAAALQRDQAKGSGATPPAQPTPAAQTQPPAQAQPTPETTAAAAKGAHPAAPKAENRNPREEELQKLQQSLGQIAETRRTPVGLVMTLGEKSIRFDSGKTDVAPQYRATLNRIAGVLKPLKGYSVYVYGYTDDNGTKDYNLTLSARRARAVRDGLVKAGVDTSLISTKGFGNSKPLVHGSTPKARAANRRVEIGIDETTSASQRSTSASKAVAKR